MACLYSVRSIFFISLSIAGSILKPAERNGVRRLVMLPAFGISSVNGEV